MRNAATRRTACLAAAAALLAGLCLGPLEARGASEEDLKKVKLGMPRADVLRIMGRPDKDQQVNDRENDLCRLYVYRNVGRYKVVDIWFDCQDKVAAIDKAG